MSTTENFSVISPTDTTFLSTNFLPSVATRHDQYKIGARVEVHPPLLNYPL